MKKIYYIERFFPATSFNEIEVVILERIIDALTKNQSTNIKKIAESCYTSPSTVSRLVKKTQLHNYSELIFFLKEKLHCDTMYTMDVLPCVSASAPLDEMFLQIQEYLTSHQIYIYGEGFCKFVCGYLYNKLLVLKHIPINLEGVELKLVHSSPLPPVLLIFSRSGETKTCLNKITECHELGGKAISFTSSATSTIFQEADLSFCIEDRLQGDQANILPNQFYGNAINLLEIIFSEIARLKNT